MVFATPKEDAATQANRSCKETMLTSVGVILGKLGYFSFN
jgi:hypothetical protein